MGRICFHCLVDPDNPTGVFSLFKQTVASRVKGDGVETGIGGEEILIRDTLTNSAVTLGRPPLKETFQKVVNHGIFKRI